MQPALLLKKVLSRAVVLAYIRAMKDLENMKGENEDEDNRYRHRQKST